MTTQLDREGHFQVRCKDYTLAEFESGAVSLNMTCQVLAAWDAETESWTSWAEYEEVEVEGAISLIKKKNPDGTAGGLNEKQIDSLCENCGWNANMGELVAKSWKPNDFQAHVKKDEYKGRVSYKIAWINPLEATPGGNGLTPMATEAAQRLQDHFGPQLRALAAKAKEKQQKPAGKPTLPPKKAPVAAVNSQEPAPF
jgi:hypothetical protein